jgi:hypothetical protein
MRGGLHCLEHLSTASYEQFRNRNTFQRKRRRAEHNYAQFVCDADDTPSKRLCDPVPPLSTYPLKLDAVLRRVARHDRLFAAMETIEGTAVLMAVQLRSMTFNDVAAVLRCDEPLTMASARKLRGHEHFVGEVLGFTPEGRVSSTTAPVVCQLMCRGQPTNVFVVAAFEPKADAPLAHAALTSRFCKVARSTEDTRR